MGGGSSKDCWFEGYPGVKQICPIQVSQKYPYLTLADLRKTQESTTNNAQYGLINSMVFASGELHTGSIGLGIMLGILLSLFFLWVRSKCKWRKKERKAKTTWCERFLHALTWTRHAPTQAPPQPVPQPAQPMSQILPVVTTGTPSVSHQLVPSAGLHRLSPPSAPTGLPALPAPPPPPQNFPTVLYSPGSFG